MNVKFSKGKKPFKKKEGFQKPNQQSAKTGNESKEKETRSCHYCKKPGHLKKNCFSWKKKQAEEEKESHTIDCVEATDVPEILNVMEGDDRSSWIVDLGCSFHVCPVKEWYQELAEGEGSVLLGNNEVCKIRGVGSVSLKLDDGSIKVLTGVRYIPEVKRNLISLGMLEKKGYTSSSGNGVMKISKEGRVVMTALRRNNLYYLTAKAVNGSINVVQAMSMKQWHIRLGHLSESGIKELAKKGLITVTDG